MKRISVILLCLLISSTLFAKRIKFAVDMTGQTISPNGVHLAGDFQAMIGFGPDWDPGTLSMTKEGNTSIYSVIVNIPAFRKYEYRFINGDLSYETEFVPEESRVGYNFVDNRWLYLDSLKNDTTFVGAIRFSANAPAGKLLVRYKVDMTYVNPVPGTGAHLGTSYQSVQYNATSSRLYSFGKNIHEIIEYIDTTGVGTATAGYVFYNGNATNLAESIPTSCAINNKRMITTVRDTVLPAYCFSSCATCLGLGITKSNLNSSNILLFPNPAKNQVSVETDLQDYSLRVTNLLGEELFFVMNQNDSVSTLNLENYNAGVYFVTIFNKQGQYTTKRLTVE